MEEVVDIDSQLENPEYKKGFRSGLMKYCSSQRKPSSSIASMFLSVATHEVWSSFSYKGRKKKRNFVAKLPKLNSLVHNIMTQTYLLKHHDIEQVIMKFLKGCPRNALRA